MKKALLVIDMQNICVGQKHDKHFTYNNKELIEKVNKRISEYEPEYVYYIKNVMKHNLLNMFAPVKAYDGSKAAQLVSEMNLVSKNVYKKYKPDAFSNSNLVQVLHDQKITNIELVGVDGSGCVAQTAFGGLKQGFKICVNTNAVATMYEEKVFKINKKLTNVGAIFI
ncbi:MAG: isochorismatase family cysteine hydrolase [Oscillospiraceae bacterium]|nr:isochorismatase family cysteine hydrolase [Oscillospiraceae bacterium]